MAATPGPGTPVPSATTLCRPAVSASGLDFLVSEYFLYLLRTTDDSRVGREELYSKLENTGYEIGYKIATRMTKETDRMLTDLDVMKWLCKEFWTELFKKQTNRLQTNSRGLFSIQDAQFRWLKPLTGAEGEESRPILMRFLLFPCGILRGALAALGIDVIVDIATLEPPAVVFQVTLRPESLPKELIVPSATT